MATYGSARNDTPSSARSAASSIGGKGGTSGSSSSGSKSSSAGSKSSSANSGMGSRSANAATGSAGYGGSSKSSAASSVGSKSSATSSVGARSANAATGASNYGGAATKGTSAADTKTAMGQRGLLGGGSILSNPSVVSQSVGGLLSGANKQGAQYGNGTFNVGYSGPKGVALDKTLNNQALVAATGPYGHYTDPRQQAMQRLVARGWTPAQAQGIIGNLAYESGMNPLAGGDFGIGMPGYSARGLAQWRGDRLAALESDTQPFTGTGRFATSGPSLEAQVDFADRELKGLASNVDRGALRVGNQFAANPGMTTAQAAAAFARGFERPSSQAFASSIGTRVAGGNVNLDGGYSAPSLSNAVRTASAPTVGRAEKIASLVAAAPKMQDRIAAEPNVNGLGFQQAAYNDRGIPSPMAGQGILGPSGLANMADLGMRQAISPSYTGAAMAQHQLAPPQRNAIMEDDMDMPAAIAQGMPVPSYDRRRNNFYTGMGAELANVAPGLMSAIRATPPSPNVQDYSGAPIAGQGIYSGVPSAGMSFNPGLPGQMPGPDRSRSPGIDGAPMAASDPRSMGPDMARTDTPTSAWNGDVLGPINPQPLSAGMSFNPGMPRNPIGGMAFNPSMSRNPIGGMAFNPGLPGQMPSDPRSRSPFVNGEPQIAANDMSRRQVAGLPDTPAQGIPGQPGLESKPTQTAQASPLNALGAIFNSVSQSAPVQKAKDAVATIKEAIPYSRFVVPPGPNSPAVGGGEGRPLRGNGEGDQQLPTQWTGRESESQVAAMAKNVEEVLRGYFVQIPGQQYPQYTTGPA